MNYLLRSMLFVPAYNEKFLEKAAGSDADAIIFDLEDAVPPAKRKAARDILGKYLADGVFAGRQLFIRVNELGSNDLIKDLKLINGRQILGVVTPKIKGVSEVEEFSNLLKKCEERDGVKEGTIKLLPLIETAGAVANVQSIAGSSKRIIALLFGGEDYLDSISGTHEYSAKAFEIPRAMIVMAARMNNLLPIDTPYMDLKNEEGFTQEERMAYSMGFAGALLVNPVQIPWANKCFGPSAQEVEHALAVLETTRKAQEEGRSIATMDGKVVGPPMLKRANKVMELDRLVKAGEKKDGADR
ncbi:MAG: CoA ester lyase [Clostridium sp.]|nr:CoA ester lyase [Clostridium sp.]